MAYPQQPGYMPGPPPNHPKATTALVLGILSLVICSILGPFAWKIGKQSMDEIDASGGQMGGRGMSQAGYILGIIATVLLIITLAIVVVALAGAFVASSSS